MVLVVAFAVALAVPGVSAGAVQARPVSPEARQPSAPGARAGAYYDFLLARRLEGEGDIDAAEAALRRAAAADPTSAEVRAELAGLFARQNRAEDALAAAKEALALDADNSEAHWVLGTIHAALLQGRQEATGAAVAADYDRAIDHLEKARPGRRFDLGLLLTLGRLHLARGDYPRAVEVLSAVVQQGWGIGDAGFLLAQAYEGAGRRGEAIEALRQTVADEPRFFRAWVLMGELLEKDQRYREAASAYGQALKQNPHAGDLQLRQANALLASGAPAAARRVLEDYVGKNPTEPTGLSLLSEAQRQALDFEAAEATARRLVALEPAGIRGAYALALVFEGRREFRRVVEVLVPATPEKADQRLRASRVYLGALARLGYAYQELGEFEQAIATFERARSLAPDSGMADLYLAQAHLAARHFDQAISIARAGREARPDDSRFVRLEAQALRQAGRIDEAAALLRARLAGAPDVVLYLSLATVYSEARRWKEAEAVLDEAQTAFPDAVDVAFQRGAIFEQQRRFADAEREFRAVLARDPDHAPTLNYLGYMFAERGERLDEAIALIERALTRDPYNGSYLDSLGWAWFKKGDARRARSPLERAAEQLPRNSVVQDHWGDVLFALGERDAAIEAWTRAVHGDGEQVDIEAIRRKLEDARRGR